MLTDDIQYLLATMNPNIRTPIRFADKICESINH